MSDAAIDLRSRYLAYIDVLNARRFDELGEYVADDVIHNDRQWRLADYQNMLRTDVAEIPDLFFDIETLVADDEHVASRILFHCTPSRPFRGHPATGKTIDFSENVFYRFEGGKIVQVWSLLDMEAVARQLG